MPHIIKNMASNSLNAAVPGNGNDQVDPIVRKLKTKEEFYAVFADCVSHEIQSEVLFENLKANLHLNYNASIGRKRKTWDRLTPAPGLCAKSGSSKKRILTKSPSILTNDSGNEIKFIYLDRSPDEVVPDIPEAIMNELKDILKRISPEKLDDVLEMLKSHAVHASDVNHNP